MPRSKKKLDEGFWIKNGIVEFPGKDLSTIIEITRNCHAKIHSTADIHDGIDELYNCDIGPRTVVKWGVYMEDCSVGADCVIEEETNIIECDIPDGSWVESTSQYGRGNSIGLIWTPGQELMVKPGCYPLEPVSETLARLSKPFEIDEWKYCSHIEDMAEELTDFLEQMKEFKCEW